MENSLIKVEDVVFRSRTEDIIKGISLEIPKGSVTALVGKSGCGKSTLLKLIAGILVPDSGRVLFELKDIQTMTGKENREFRKRCAFVFQDSALWANQDIMQNLSLPLQIHYPDMSVQERKNVIDSTCALVHFDRPLTLRPSDLSMGEQKKVAFARAMICNPEVLFLDECTESLDKKSKAVIIELLKDFVQKGNSIVYVSHSSSFMKEFPGTVYTLEEGSLSNAKYTGEEDEE